MLNRYCIPLDCGKWFSQARYAPQHAMYAVFSKTSRYAHVSLLPSQKLVRSGTSKAKAELLFLKFWDRSCHKVSALDKSCDDFVEYREFIPFVKPAPVDEAAAKKQKQKGNLNFTIFVLTIRKATRVRTASRVSIQAEPKAYDRENTSWWCL